MRILRFTSTEDVTQIYFYPGGDIGLPLLRRRLRFTPNEEGTQVYLH
jgi:hypothetical protein